MMMFCYIACFLFAIAFLDSFRLYYNMKKCNCSTTGTIIEVLETLGHSKNGTYLIYEPVYKYTILGEKYIGQADIISTDPDRSKVNSEVLLYYEESNPQNFIPIDEVKNVKTNIIKCGLFFVFFLTIVVLGVLEESKK